MSLLRKCPEDNSSEIGMISERCNGVLELHLVPLSIVDVQAEVTMSRRIEETTEIGHLAKPNNS